MNRTPHLTPALSPPSEGAERENHLVALKTCLKICAPLVIRLQYG